MAMNAPMPINAMNQLSAIMPNEMMKDDPIVYNGCRTQRYGPLVESLCSLRVALTGVMPVPMLLNNQ